MQQLFSFGLAQLQAEEIISEALPQCRPTGLLPTQVSRTGKLSPTQDLLLYPLSVNQRRGGSQGQRERKRRGAFL